MQLHGRAEGSCDQRKNCCNAFRYGQCNTQVRQVGGVQCRVVSCTPPWKWENCSTAPATDNRTRDHNSDHLPTAWSPITARYTALGENGSVLGASVWREFDVAGGRAQRYQRGRISWSRATGARETVGPIAMRYVVLGGEAGVLGFPVSPEYGATDRRGRASRFQRGRISWHPETGAWETRGDIARRYETASAEGGALGYPVGAELAVAGGRASRFQRGRISSSPSTGVALLRQQAAARFAALDAEAGPLGFPTADDRVLPDGGTAAVFQRGRISWSARTGAWETRGDIATAYAALGGETGVLGYPVEAEQEVVGRRPGGTVRARPLLRRPGHGRALDPGPDRRAVRADRSRARACWATRPTTSRSRARGCASARSSAAGSPTTRRAGRRRSSRRPRAGRRPPTGT